MPEGEQKFEEETKESKRESGVLRYVGFNTEDEESIT